VLDRLSSSSRSAITLLPLAACISLAIASPTRAQSQQGEIHANYSRTTQSKTSSWGAGAQSQQVWGSTSSPVALSNSAGVDYLKQENGGPSQWSLSLDVVLQPGGNSTVTPYAGGSISANWSTGDAAQWSGARLGTELIGGAQVKLGTGSPVSAKLEERFGYVNGQEHTLATRLGFSLSF
jgi:hypothetical protein